MNIGLVYIHYPVSIPRFLKRALLRLGHEVKSIGPATGGYIPWLPTTDFSQYADIPNSEAWIPEFVPDFMLQGDANYQMQVKVPWQNVCYAVDNHVAPYDQVDYDLFFGAHSEGSKGKDPKKFIWLPCGYDPLLHSDLGMKRELDAVMVGVGYPQRIALMEALSKVSDKVQGFTGLLGEKYNLAYNQSKIAVVRSARNDVACRVFENMAQKCMVLSDNVPDLAKLGLKDSDQLVLYNSDTEAVEKFRYYLAHDQEREEIAARGAAWVKPHSWDDRAKVICDTVSSSGRG